MDDIPQELDWVKVRAACSLVKVFKELHTGAIQDVEQMNLEHKSNALKPSFGTTDGSAGTVFMVFQEGTPHPGFSEAQSRTGRFSLRDDRIEIRGVSCSVEMTITLTINDKGRCKLRVGGQDLEQWQVRKMALEDLFFGPRS